MRLMCDASHPWMNSTIYERALVVSTVNGRCRDGAKHTCITISSPLRRRASAWRA
jgi:hypothetical protein